MTPIKTIIRNKKPVAKAVNYIGKSPVWLPANGETTVDFEIWSVATDSQKTSIKTLCECGAIELSVMIMGPNGEYTVAEFDPLGGKKAPPVIEVKTEEPAILNPVKQMADEKDHIVKVGSAESKAILEGMGAKAVGFEDEDILPTREVKNGEPEDKATSENDGTVNGVPVRENATAVTGSGEEAPKKASKKGTKAKA